MKVNLLNRSTIRKSTHQETQNGSEEVYYPELQTETPNLSFGKCFTGMTSQRNRIAYKHALSNRQKTSTIIIPYLSLKKNNTSCSSIMCPHQTLGKANNLSKETHINTIPVKSLFIRSSAVRTKVI